MKGKWIVPLVLIAVIAVGAVASAACSRNKRPLSNQVKTEVSPSSEPTPAAATAGPGESVAGSESAETPPSTPPAATAATAKPAEKIESEAVSAANAQSEPGNKPSEVSASSASAPGEAAGRGDAAIQKAAAADKYLLIFFYKADDEQTQAMRKVFDSAVKKVADRAQYVVVDISNPSEKPIVAKFGVDRAPMPLALVLAPTGAVTGGFPIKFEESQLTGAFVSQGLAKSLKALQDGKLVLLCVQSGNTKSNDAAMQGVNAFKTDARYAKSTEVVKIDPTDDRELKFLTQVQIDPKTSEAVTALVVPPGSVAAKYSGATDKDVMIAALAALKAGGGGG
jgi:hypothetical protein